MSKSAVNNSHFRKWVIAGKEQNKKDQNKLILSLVSYWLLLSGVWSNIEFRNVCTLREGLCYSVGCC